MTLIQLPTDLLRLIHSSASSIALDAQSILISIDGDVARVRQSNSTNSALILLESTKLNSGLDGVSLPIDVADLKTVLGLAKDVPIVLFDVDDGITTCKIRKIKKQFTQPSIEQIIRKEPTFQTTATVTLDDQQCADIVSAFSGMMNMDLKITTSSENGISFKVSDENKYTSIEFSTSDLSSFRADENTVAGYDLDMAISLFKTKQKGSVLSMEYGTDMPIKIVQTTNSGTVITFLAPKIYD